MKQIFRSCMALMIVLGMITALIGCGSSMKEKPEQVVTNFFESLKKADFDTAKSYMDGSGNITDFNEPQQEKIVESMMGKIKYEIVSANIEDDTATVKAKIVSADLVKIVADVIKELFPKLVELAFSGEEDVEAKSEELTLKSFNDEFSKADMPTVSSEIDIKLKADKENKVWKIVADDTLANAITGNASAAFSEMDKLSEEDITQAEQQDTETVVNSEGVEAILGTWERFGESDEFSGIQIRIEKTENGYIGKFIKLNDAAKNTGFMMDEIKWKDISKVSENNFEFKDLGKSDSGDLWYEMVMQVVDNGSILKLKDKVTEGESVGSEQSWKKVG